MGVSDECGFADGPDDHLCWVKPAFLNLEIMGITHLEHVKQV